MFNQVESVILFVSDIDAASKWYSKIFNLEIEFENSQYAFIRTPSVILGFHPSDSKNPGGIGGATVYWEVENLEETIRELELLGAKLYRGSITTSLGAKAAMLMDPFGCSLGINQSQ